MTLALIAFFASLFITRWASRPMSPASEAGEVHSPAKPKSQEAAGAANSTATASPAKTRRELLRDALDGDDPLASARRTIAWLETATRVDFDALAADPDHFPIPHFSGFDQAFRTAFFDALAERWFALDPGGALPAMQRVQGKLKEKDRYDSGEILQAAARVRPELVLEKLPMGSKDGHFELSSRVALETLGERNPAAARKYLDRIKSPGLLKSAQDAIASGLARKDPLAAIAMAKEFGTDSVYWSVLEEAERIGPGMVRQVFAAADGKLDGDWRLPQLLLRNPELAAEVRDPTKLKPADTIQPETQRAADRLSPEERARVVANYDSLPAAARETLAAALASSWARTAPREAADWALSLAKAGERTAPENLATDQVFLRWINTDPDAALAWWNALPASPLRDAIGTNASTFLAEDGRLDEAMKLFRPQAVKVEPTKRNSDSVVILSGGGEGGDSMATAQLTQLLAERDPAAAAAWLAALPPAVATKDSARVVIDEWMPRNPEAVARWVESLPAGKRRDDALGVFIEKAASQSPSGAAEWVATIADPILRQNAALHTFWRWNLEDPAAAVQWLRELRGVDPEWQARVLRRWK